MTLPPALRTVAVMRPVTLIVIHCSASPNGDTLFRGTYDQPGFQTPVDLIDGWHKARGFHRDPEARKRFNPSLSAIGYHFVIYRNGVVVTGRAQEEVGAHAQGHNQKSLGICLVGTDEFTRKQWESLAGLAESLKKLYPARFVGHRDLSPDRNGNGVIEPREWTKTCPGFDVAEWIARGMTPPKGVL